MANKVIVTKSKLNNIGDAIREKLGKTQQYSLDEMPVKIRAISGSGSGSGATVTITTETEDFYGKNVTLTDGMDTMTVRFSNSGVAVFSGVEMEGMLTASVTLEENVYSTQVNVKSSYSCILNDVPKIYGVTRTLTVSNETKWTRTDAAEEFNNPTPQVGEGGTGVSPFDSIYPWAGMQVVERRGGTMVAIPKFYYKMTKETGNMVSIKISATPEVGYSTSPAHIDRGDGKGERDVVYVGRYQSTSDYKSKTDATPITDVLRGTARNGIHSIGANYWPIDFLTLWTIWLLYIVEYADWDCQGVIGNGGGNGNGPEKTGSTDNMNYHTGTIHPGKAVNGVGIQYRNIEGLWSNVMQWVDGMLVNTRGRAHRLFVFKNPNLFSDSDYTNATEIAYDYESTNASIWGTVVYYDVSTDLGIPILANPAGWASGYYPHAYLATTFTYDGSAPLAGASGADYRSDRNASYVPNMVSFEHKQAADAQAPYIGCRIMELP